MKIEGKNAVREALKAGKTINALYVSKDTNDNMVKSLIRLAREQKIKVTYCDKFYLNKISETKAHQGIIAESIDFNYSELQEILDVAIVKNEPNFIVILDGIEDPHNLGAIIRTCECAGVHGIIIPNRRACPVNETVIKTSAGAAEHMKICMVTNINQTIDTLKKQNIWVYGIELGGTDLFKANLQGNIALVIGSEGNGISKLTKEKCDGILTMSMYGKVNSLNASVAAGISIFEVLKQRNV